MALRGKSVTVSAKSEQQICVALLRQCLLWGRSHRWPLIRVNVFVLRRLFASWRTSKALPLSNLLFYWGGIILLFNTQVKNTVWVKYEAMNVLHSRGAWEQNFQETLGQCFNHQKRNYWQLCQLLLLSNEATFTAFSLQPLTHKKG